MNKNQKVWAFGNNLRWIMTFQIFGYLGILGQMKAFLCFFFAHHTGWFRRTSWVVSHSVAAWAARGGPWVELQATERIPVARTHSSRDSYPELVNEARRRMLVTNENDDERRMLVTIHPLKIMFVYQKCRKKVSLCTKKARKCPNLPLLMIVSSFGQNLVFYELRS